MAFLFLPQDIPNIRSRLDQYVNGSYEIGVVVFCLTEGERIIEELNYFKVERTSVSSAILKDINDYLNCEVRLDDYEYGLSFLFAYKDDVNSPIAMIEVFYNRYEIIEFLNVIDHTEGCEHAVFYLSI